jgi:fibronectin-binding autotransporter adhesin
MSRILYLCVALCSGLTGLAQSEQKEFWALNGAYAGYVWDNGQNNNQISNGSGNWTSGTKVWTINGGVSDIAWTSGAAAIFGGNPGIGAAGTVTITGTQTVSSLTFNPTPGGTFTLTSGTITNTSGNIIANDTAVISSTLGGSAGLTLSGNYPITLTSPTTYTGTTTINSGTLILSNGTAGTTTPTLTTPVVIASGGTLAADILTENINISGAISGAGTLSIANTGVQAQTLRLYGNNSGFTGNFSEPSTTRGMMWSDNVGTGNAANTGSAAAAWNLSGVFGMIETAGSATPTVQLGSLSGTNTATAIGGFGGSGTKTFQVGALNTSTSFAGAIQDNPQGSGTPVIALSKTGTGTLTLSGTNTYSGSTTVSAGTLAFTTAIPSSNTWNIAVNATSTPTTANSGLMTIPSTFSLIGKTINIVLTGSSTGFTYTAVSWSGTVTLGPALQLNGTPVTSGIASGGTTVTFVSGTGIKVSR